METLFAGTRVLDLSTVLAGPSVATFFAELGATVIKVENPRRKGDVTRSWKLSSENAQSEISAYFASVNYRKSYVWIDISASENRNQLEELIRTRDIIITNFKEGDDRKFRLTSEDVHAIQPKAIMASLKGFLSHPNRIAYDVVLQAECGFMFMNGTAQSGPLKMPVALIDVIAAHQMKEGILCALLRRVETGKGSTVRVTLEEAALSALANQASNYLMAGHIAQAAGSLHPNIAPYGETFRCSDNKRLVLAVGSDVQFNRLCEVMGLEELKNDVRFSTNQSRVVNRQDLAAALQGAFELNTREHWMQHLIDGAIPAGAIRSMDEVMESGAAQNMIREENISEQPTRRMSSIAFKLES
jgi:crotonobetainyl-CoA:carnitine CoA-transferase CaiB-like acyl-CoA transferase